MLEAVGVGVGDDVGLAVVGVDLVVVVVDGGGVVGGGGEGAGGFSPFGNPV